MENLHIKLQPLTILIVEDDESTLKWLNRILSIYFQKVYTANNAIDAYNIFKENPTDVVLADIQIPEVDGLNLLQKIATIQPSSLRIIMTAFNNQIYLNRAIDAEINFYFKKPIDIDELLITISLNINKQRKVTSILELKNEYIYDSVQKIIQVNDKKIKLTKKESLLLEYLYENKNAIVSLDQIENVVWKEPVTNDAIRMVVSGLRKKLYNNCIENIKGFGYRLSID